MTFKQEQQKEAMAYMRGAANKQRVAMSVADAINATLKEVEETLGEERVILKLKKGSFFNSLERGRSQGHNTLHRKVKAKLLELSK